MAVLAILSTSAFAQIVEVPRDAASGALYVGATLPPHCQPNVSSGKPISIDTLLKADTGAVYTCVDGAWVLRTNIATDGLVSAAGTAPLTLTLIAKALSGSIAVTPTNPGGAVALQATTPGTAQTGNVNLSGSALAGRLKLGVGVTAGAGLQHIRVASCTTDVTLNATCDTTVTWAVAFADANYTATATLDTPTGTGIPMVMSTSAKTTTTMVVTILDIGAGASGGTINVTAVHD